MILATSELDLQFRAAQLTQFGCSSSLRSEGFLVGRQSLCGSATIPGLDLRFRTTWLTFTVLRLPKNAGGRPVKAMGGSTGEQGEVVIMRSRSGQSLCYLQMDGVLYPPLPDYTSHLKQLRDFPCRLDDVWIFGYPKSGKKCFSVRYC